MQPWPAREKAIQAGREAIQTTGPTSDHDQVIPAGCHGHRAVVGWWQACLRLHLALPPQEDQAALLAADEHLLLLQHSNTPYLATANLHLDKGGWIFLNIKAID